MNKLGNNNISIKYFFNKKKNNNIITDEIIYIIISKFNNNVINKLGKYNKKILIKLKNINKAGVDNSIPCSTKRVPQNSRICISYELVKFNNLTLDILKSYKNGLCIYLLPSKYIEIVNNSNKDILDEYIINNIGSDNIVSCIISIIKTSGYSGSSNERKEKIILDELIITNNWKPITKLKKDNKGNDKWTGHYYFNISGGEQVTYKSWTGNEPQIFTTYKGFMSNEDVINSVKASLIYMILHVHDINKVLNESDVLYYKNIYRNYLNNKIYYDKSCYDNMQLLKCFDKEKNLISPILCEKISIDDFCINDKINISHNIAVSKQLILECKYNNIMLSDYRPGNLFWDFKIANMRQQDDTIEEYWQSIEKSILLRTISY